MKKIVGTVFGIFEKSLKVENLPKTTMVVTVLSPVLGIAINKTNKTFNIKWDNFDILATGRADIHCRIKKTLLIRDLKPAMNENVGSEKLFLY